MDLRSSFSVILVFLVLLGLPGDLESGSPKSGSRSPKSGGGFRNFFRKLHIPRIMQPFYKRFKGTERLENGVVVITGGASGIGEETAAELYRRGVMLADHQVIEDTKTELHIQSNHLGHFFLTILLLPRLIRSGPSRIVNVSSKAHEYWRGGVIDFENEKALQMDPEKYSRWQAYARSKLFNIWFSAELSRRLRSHGVTTVNTYSLHPGIVHTPLYRHVKKWKWVGESLHKFFETGFMKYFLRTPKEGAQTTLYCTLSTDVKDESGLYYSNCHKKTPTKRAQDTAQPKQLWEFSMRKLAIAGVLEPGYDEESMYVSG
nr:PREDICTED: retinol dehydrogenase 11-like isoform X2 [Bemisia tabaci]